ncbi:hypothetical protein [Parvimonas micra]
MEKLIKMFLIYGKQKLFLEVKGAKEHNLKNINVTVKILQPLDKTKTIVEVKDGKIIKDIMK